MLKSPLKVLVAEGSSDLALRVRELLSELDFVTSIGYAKNGHEALALAEFMNPDFILLDIKMPGMNDLDVLEKLRLQKHEVKIILLTTHPDEYLRQKCLELGADYYLDKMLEFDQIADILRYQPRQSAAS
ncbi:MAG: response regulator [Bacteroidetes bacterium]|nr:response regulator [Bacteroidota bacterium]MBL0066846.1 response regulator [Bacteroidota bacterium]MBL0140248.1 response regulator [Bacteroidota bacterium]